jgi:hypothetical protein
MFENNYYAIILSEATKNASNDLSMTITCICFLVRTARFEPAAYGSEALRLCRDRIGARTNLGRE